MGLFNKKLIRSIQTLLGLWLIFSAIAAYLPFPQPQFNEAASAFLGALFSTGYLIYLMQLVFVLSGLMLLFNKFPAFGAILLAPVTLNILLFHIFLDTTNVIIALIFTLFHIYLGAAFWPKYKPMFS